MSHGESKGSGNSKSSFRSRKSGFSSTPAQDEYEIPVLKPHGISGVHTQIHGQATPNTDEYSSDAPLEGVIVVQHNILRDDV